MDRDRVLFCGVTKFIGGTIGHTTTACSEVGDDSSRRGGINPELVRLGDAEVSATEFGGVAERVADGVMELEVVGLGFGSEVADGDVVVVTDARVEAQAVADLDATRSVVRR